MWPASAMLTGSGVALILRVPTTPAGRPLELSRLVRVRWCRRAQPVDEVPHPVSRLARVQPVEHRARRGVPRARQHTGGTARLLVGAPRPRHDHGLRRHPRRRAADHGPPRSPRRRGIVLGRAGRRRRVARGVGALHGGALGVRAGVRVRVLAGDHHVARGPHLPVLHDHGPEDAAGRASRPRRVRAARRPRQHAPDGAADERVRDEGRVARRPGDRLRMSSAPRPPGSRATIDGGRSPLVGEATSDRSRSRRADAPCARSNGRLAGGRLRGGGRHRRRRRPGPWGHRPEPQRRPRPCTARRRPGHLPHDLRRAGGPGLEPRDQWPGRPGDRPEPRREPAAREPGLAPWRRDDPGGRRPRRPARRDAGPAALGGGERVDCGRALRDRRGATSPCSSPSAARTV